MEEQNNNIAYASSANIIDDISDSVKKFFEEIGDFIDDTVHVVKESINSLTNKKMFTYNGNASAVINDFITPENILNFAISPLSTFYRLGAALVFNAVTGNTLTVNSDSDSSDETIYYSADGVNVLGAKLADESTTNLIYDAGVILYSFMTGNTGNLVINDNSNHDIWLDGSDGSYYNNVVNIDARDNSGNDMLVGNVLSNIIYAGKGLSTLWGGSGGDDTLVGGDNRDEFKFSGNGNNIVQNFDSGSGDNDDIVLLDCELSAATRSGSNIILTASNGNNIQLQTDATEGDVDILYSTDDSTIYTARFADDNSLSIKYSDNIDYYNMKERGSLTLQDDEAHDIWLDGSAGIWYGNVANIDASNSNGNDILAGDSQSNEIRAGNGNNSSLWGGTGDVNDVLYGGAGCDMFWYGKNDGNDIVNNASSNDIVNLYDVAIGDITEATVSDNSVSLSFTGGSSLIVNDDGGSSTSTFYLADDNVYVYDRAGGQWQASRK